MNTKEYLKHGMELEKTLYTLNQAITYLQQKKDNIERNINRANKPIVPMKPEIETRGFKIFFNCLVFLILGLPVGAVLGFINLILGNGFWFFFLLIIIISLITGIMVGSLNDNDDERKVFEYEEALKKYDTELQDYKIYSKNQLNKKSSIEKQIAILVQQKREISKTLQKIYDMNVIYPKYRNFVAIVTMYEYFDSGRCTSLEGHEGAYNIYENEIRLNAIIGKLEDIIEHLEDIRTSQYAIYNAINEGNRIAINVYQQSEKILNSADVMASNSAITAYNSEITARNSQILSFIATYNAIRY